MINWDCYSQLSIPPGPWAVAQPAVLLAARTSDGSPTLNAPDKPCFRGGWNMMKPWHIWSMEPYNGVFHVGSMGLIVHIEGPTIPMDQFDLIGLFVNVSSELISVVYSQFAFGRVLFCHVLTALWPSMVIHRIFLVKLLYQDTNRAAMQTSRGTTYCRSFKKSGNFNKQSSSRFLHTTCGHGKTVATFLNWQSRISKDNWLIL